MTGPSPDDVRGSGGSDAEVAGVEERTRLAWRRTVLSALVVSLLAVSKLIVTTPAHGGAVVVALMVAGWFALLGLADRRMAILRADQRVIVKRSPALVALLVIGFAVLALTLLR